MDIETIRYMRIQGDVKRILKEVKEINQFLHSSHEEKMLSDGWIKREIGEETLWIKEE